MEQPKQIKSQWYYIFWAACAVAVVGGQIYVGQGYREMAEAQRANTTYWKNTFDRVLPRWKTEGPQLPPSHQRGFSLHW